MVYLGHRQLRTYQQMPDAKVAGGGFNRVCVCVSGDSWGD